MQAGGGYYPPLCRFSASSRKAGGSQPPHGHEGAQGAGPHVGGRSFVLRRVTLRRRTLAFWPGTPGALSDSYARERCCGVSACGYTELCYSVIGPYCSSGAVLLANIVHLPSTTC